MSGVTTPQAVLRARASVARRLIRHGQVSPWTGLFYVVCPTDAIREAEQEARLAARWQAAQRQERRRLEREAA